MNFTQAASSTDRYEQAPEEASNYVASTADLAKLSSEDHILRQKLQAFIDTPPLLDGCVRTFHLTDYSGGWSILNTGPRPTKEHNWNLLRKNLTAGLFVSRLSPLSFGFPGKGWRQRALNNNYGKDVEGFDKEPQEEFVKSRAQMCLVLDVPKEILKDARCENEEYMKENRNVYFIPKKVFDAMGLDSLPPQNVVFAFRTTLETSCADPPSALVNRLETALGTGRYFEAAWLLELGVPPKPNDSPALSAVLSILTVSYPSVKEEDEGEEEEEEEDEEDKASFKSCAEEEEQDGAYATTMQACSEPEQRTTAIEQGAVELTKVILMTEHLAEEKAEEEEAEEKTREWEKKEEAGEVDDPFAMVGAWVTSMKEDLAVENAEEEAEEKERDRDEKEEAREVDDQCAMVGARIKEEGEAKAEQEDEWAMMGGMGAQEVCKGTLMKEVGAMQKEEGEEDEDAEVEEEEAEGEEGKDDETEEDEKTDEMDLHVSPFDLEGVWIRNVFGRSFHGQVTISLDGDSFIIDHPTFCQNTLRIDELIKRDHLRFRSFTGKCFSKKKITWDKGSSWIKKDPHETEKATNC